MNGLFTMSTWRGLGKIARSAYPSTLRSIRASALGVRMNDLLPELDQTTTVGGGLMGTLVVAKPPIASCVGGPSGMAHAADPGENDDLDEVISHSRSFMNRFSGHKECRKRVVVRVVDLGSGCGALSFVRKLDPMAFDITIVSPLN